MARQLRLGALRSLVTDFFAVDASRELLIRETEFIRALTGGVFGSRSRICDPTRSREVHLSAANYLTELPSGAAPPTGFKHRRAFTALGARPVSLAHDGGFRLLLK
jgi:hypothetical protein